MSRFKYSDAELDVNKVLKMNQDISQSILNNADISDMRSQADNNIASSMELLQSLGKSTSIQKMSKEIEEKGNDRVPKHCPNLEDWESIFALANQYEPNPVFLEDILSESEINKALCELDEINSEFSRKTNIINKTDLSFLTVATALQVVKALLFPYGAKKFNYGEQIDKSKRLNHNDKSIEDAHKKANDTFRDRELKKHKTGHWINLLYQTPPYDITKGSVDLGINMGGAYHRLYTLGHDPILGWIFGTANILTDVITLNSFQSYRVTRSPMKITPEIVPLGKLFQESYEYVKEDFLNLPAAVFAQSQHFESDKYTKLGLPIPMITSINENFASKLYKSNYDSLCLARDLKIVGASFIVSKLIDIIISLVHGLFRQEDELQDLYEVRTRKILLISNTIATTSTLINTSITANPQNLDIGSLLSTVTHLFSDVRYIAKIKQEFIDNEISVKLQAELEEIDCLFENFTPVNRTM